MTADTRVREIITNHRRCVSFPSCCMDSSHVRLSDDERAVLRQMLEGSEARTRSAPSRQPSAATRAGRGHNKNPDQGSFLPRQSAQPQQPTAEQWKSVRVVLERVRDAGRKFPEIEIDWTGDSTLPDDANATTTIHANGSCTVRLRCSQSAAELRSTFGHELGHCWDAELLVPGRARLARHVAEDRATKFAELFGW